MNDAVRSCLHYVLVVVALAGAPACARCETVAGRGSQDPHARALVLAMEHDATRHANAGASECGAVTWTVVRPVEPGVFDTTGRLHVRACRAGIPCRELYVDIWDSQVAERPEWKGSAHGVSLPPLDLESMRARLPRADGAVLLVVAHEDAPALLGNLKINPWFDVEARTWRAEPVRSKAGDLGCDRWNVDLRIGNVEVMRWTVDLAVGSVSRNK